MKHIAQTVVGRQRIPEVAKLSITGVGIRSRAGVTDKLLHRLPKLESTLTLSVR